MSADDVQDDVKVVGDKTSDVVKVTASASSAKRAALLANTYAENARRLASDDDRQLARAGPRQPPQAVRRPARERAEPRVGPGRPAPQQHAEDAGDRGCRQRQPADHAARLRARLQGGQPDPDDHPRPAVRRRAGRRPGAPARAERSPPPRRGRGLGRLRRPRAHHRAAPPRAQARGAVRRPAARGGGGVPNASDEPPLRLGRARAQRGHHLLALTGGQDHRSPGTSPAPASPPA